MKKILVICLMVFASAAWASDYEDGVAAYAKGNNEVALKKYKKAAEQGSAHAQRNLGLMYYNGVGVAQNYAEAMKWYKLAAEKGLASAQFNIGLMFDNGQGVAQDFTRAHMWYNLAAVSGDKDAVKNRDLTAARMTPKQIAQAQQLARKCTARNFQNCD